MNLSKQITKAKDFCSLMSSKFLTNGELQDYYNTEFKPSDLHSVEVKSFDEVQEVSFIAKI